MLFMKFKYALISGLLFLAVIVLAPLLSACTTQTPTSTPPPAASSTTSATPSSTSFEGYGIYESCNPKDEATCLSHLNTMAAAGFKLVINYDEMYGDARFQKAYLDRAQSVGMKVIITLKDHRFYNGKSLRSEFPALAQTCNCTGNNGFIRYVVNLVKNHPAVWGYYIGDEVDPSDHGTMKSALADVVHQLDPTHPRLFIDNAGESTSVWHGNSPFFDTAEVIGTDFYPVGHHSPYPTIHQTAAVVGGIQAYADAHGEDGAIVLQAFS